MPNCDATYHVVKAEVEPEFAHRETTCRTCGGPVPGREGKFVMKYFPLRKSQLRRLKGQRKTLAEAASLVCKCPSGTLIFGGGIPARRERTSVVVSILRSGHKQRWAAERRRNREGRGRRMGNLPILSTVSID